MSLLWGKQEERATYFQDFWGRGGNTENLLGQGMAGALSLVPLYSATRLLADQLSSLPLHTYRQEGDLAKRIPDPSLLRNPSVVAGGQFAWTYRACTSLLLQGNAYGLVTQTSNGFPTMVEWIHPGFVAIDDSMYPVVKYYYRGRLMDPTNLIHIPLYSLPGSARGLSPITAFRLTIEQGLQAQQFSVDWFRNGGMPAGHLKKMDKTLTAAESQIAKDRYKTAIQDRDILVTGNDWEIKPITISADDAAFVATARLNAGQIAAVYGLDAEDVGGEAANSLTYATMEQKGIRFTTFPLRPLAIRLEEAITEMLPKPQYVKFNLDALVRADIKTRYEVHQIALTTGLETQDEGRIVEDKPPLDDAQRTTWKENYPTPPPTADKPRPTPK